MVLLNICNVRFSYGTTNILENINIKIEDNDKVGIVGVNGAGKSTLFKIITGKIQSDEGEVFLSKNAKIGYLEQNTGLDLQNSILQEILLVFSHLTKVETTLKELENQITHEKDSEILSKILKEHEKLIEYYGRNGGYEYQSRCRGVLIGLGFSPHQFDMQINLLSGGQKTRLSMAKLLLEEPDLLLLDEPTNHLDINAIEWLEDFLTHYNKAFILISHDRYFLDKTIKKTMQIEHCTSTTYHGNYSKYLELKEIERENQQKKFDTQQKEIARLEAYIEQQRRWNREKNIIAAESRQKAIDRMEKVDQPKNAPKKIKIKLKSDLISGNDVLFVEHLAKEFPSKVLFENLNFTVRKNERIFILGPNGCGKSTLLKIICGFIEPNKGDVKLGHHVEMGYYDQEQRSLNDENTIIDEVWEEDEKITQTQLRNILASFQFMGEEVYKKIGVLSGGEKGRVALARLLLSGANLLIMDEPTNHLDINSRESLENALLEYDGTLIIVSHDRYFIEKLATRIIEFGFSDLLDFKGSYPDFLEYRSRFTKASEITNTQKEITESKVNHLQTKEEKAKKRKSEKVLKETEAEIAIIEKRLMEIDELIGTEVIARDHVRLLELTNEKETLQSRLESLYEVWLENSSL